jgi:ribosome maturation factor RimP
VARNPLPNTRGAVASAAAPFLFQGPGILVSLDLQTRLRALFEPTVSALGFDLVAVEWVGDVRGPLLRVSIDRIPGQVPAGGEGGGISAAACGRVSEHLSQILDEHDPIERSYRLEVSSPGIDRPVQRLTDFARFHGYKVRCRLAEGPRKRFTGKILGTDGDFVNVEADGQQIRFNIDAVERAHLVLDLAEFERLGQGLPEVPATSPTPESGHDRQ